MEALTVLLVAGVLYAGALVRIQQAHRFRMRLLHQISDAARKDIARHLPWHWRFEVFGRVSYERQILQFWRPMESFYDIAYLLGEQGPRGG